MHEFNLIIWLGGKLGLSGVVNHATVHIFSAALVALFLILMGVIFRLKFKDTSRWVVPNEKVSFVGVVDFIASQILSIMKGVMGSSAIKFLPLIGSLFLYIFFCNFLSLIPGFAPPTDNINTNLACALVVFVYYNIMGFREHGIIGYLKHFAGPIVWLWPLMFALELISHLVRPVSLSVRLFGNITGDHMVLGIFSHLVPLVVPIVFLGLALFIAFIQAFVFSLLSTVYIALATERE